MTFSRPAFSVFILSVIVQVTVINLASADDVNIRSTYPLVYGEYTNASAENTFSAGTTVSGAIANIYGDVNVLGDFVITLPANCRVRVAPNMGPYTNDGFRVEATGNISVGRWIAANPPLLKVSTVLIGGNFYAWGDPLDSPQVVGTMHGFIDPDTSLTTHQRKKAQFASRLVASPPTLDPTSTADYAPMRMEAREVVFGTDYSSRNTLPGSAGDMQRVLIGTRAAWTPTPTGVSPEPEVFLQVGNPNETLAPVTTDKVGSPVNPAIGDVPNSPRPPASPGGGSSGFRIFSSREYKKDIIPLTPAQCGAALGEIARLDVVKYHFKSEPKSSVLHTGLIAEDLPEMIKSSNGKSLNIAEAYAYAAAALKALKVENDALKARLAVLESRAGKARS